MSCRAAFGPIVGDMRRCPPQLGLILLLLLAFALRVGYCVAEGSLGRTPPRGYREYVETAQRLLKHGTITSPLLTEDVDSAPSVILPPIYVLLVAGVYSLLGVETFWSTLTLHVINALATSMTAAVVFLVARGLGGARAGWVAGLVTTLNPTLIGYTAFIWDTSLFACGVALSVWISFRLTLRPSSWTAYLAFGFWLGGLALLNPALTIAYPLLILWPLTAAKGWRFATLARGVAAAVCGWLIALTPWTVRNYVHFGELLYVRGGFPVELWMGVSPEADTNPSAMFRANFPLQNAVAQRRVREIGEAAFLTECGRLARAAIAADPWRWARLIARRTVDYWSGTVRTHAEPGGGWWPRSRGRAAVMLFLAAEFITGLLSGLVFRRWSRDPAWLAAIVVSFSIVYCLTHIQIRYRAPSEPILAIVLALLTTGVARAKPSDSSADGATTPPARRA